MTGWSRFFNQTICYWVPGERIGTSLQFGAPIEFNASVSFTPEKYIKDDGIEATTSTIIFTDRELEASGYVYVGEIVDIPEASKNDPRKYAEAHTIKKVIIAQELHTNQYMYKVML